MKTNPVQIIASQAMSDALVTYYTSPANKKTLISKVSITNIGTAALAFDLHVVPSGGAASTANKIFSAEVVDSGASLPLHQIEAQILEAGDFIQAKINTATSTDLTILGSGYEII